LWLANVDTGPWQSRRALTVPKQNVPSRRGRGVFAFREFTPRVLPPVFLVVGLAIALASLESEVENGYSTSFSGTIAPGNQTVPIGPWDAQYLEVNMPVGACDVRVYLASTAEAALFNSTGERPARWIGCTDRSTTTTGASY